MNTLLLISNFDTISWYSNKQTIISEIHKIWKRKKSMHIVIKVKTFDNYRYIRRIEANGNIYQKKNESTGA